MSDHETHHEGGCFCGRIRYRIGGPVKAVANCHCTMCRRTSGAPFVSWLVVDKSRFTFTGEMPARLDSSDHGQRYFCDHCGTPVTCELDEHANLVDVTLCSLDEPSAFTPDMEVYGDTRLDWVSPMPRKA